MKQLNIDISSHTGLHIVVGSELYLLRFVLASCTERGGERWREVELKSLGLDNETKNTLPLVLNYLIEFTHCTHKPKYTYYLGAAVTQYPQLVIRELTNK